MRKEILLWRKEPGMGISENKSGQIQGEKKREMRFFTNLLGKVPEEGQKIEVVMPWREGKNIVGQLNPRVKVAEQVAKLSYTYDSFPSSININVARDLKKEIPIEGAFKDTLILSAKGLNKKYENMSFSEIGKDLIEDSMAKYEEGYEESLREEIRKKQYRPGDYRGN